MPSFKDLVKDAKAQIEEVSAEETRTLLQTARNGDAPVVIDVRERDEWDNGYVPGAIYIGRGVLESRIEDRVPERDRSIILYCQSGNRSALSAVGLKALGYTRVRSMAGGFGKWKQLGYAFDMPRALSAEQQKRYSRHLLVPEVGEAGQHKLLDAKVLCIGAGGLGSPSALYLAAAGVGTLGIIDDDVVDLSNLQRQILHTNDRVGVHKVESARITINALNPDVKVVEHRTRLNRDNVLELFSQYDIILDGCDNFATRYLVNDACVKLRKPNVHGSIYRFEGQVTVFKPFEGPCYRCLYPNPPPPELAPSCAEAGVLGVLPGVVGVLEAVEVVKLILGAGRPLAGRLLHYDALDAKFREMKLRRDPQCPVCADPAKEIELIDYEWFCSMPAPGAEKPAPTPPPLSVTAAAG